MGRFDISNLINEYKHLIVIPKDSQSHLKTDNYMVS